jgi:hypothetical protein
MKEDLPFGEYLESDTRIETLEATVKQLLMKIDTLESALGETMIAAQLAMGLHHHRGGALR